MRCTACTTPAWFCCRTGNCCSSTCSTLFNEFFFKPITGDLDAAADWDAYVAEWRKAGGDDIIAELERAPIVSEFRQGRLTY